MTNEEKLQLRELGVRRAAARQCVQTVSAVEDSDPRKADALAHYNAQLAEIDRRITEITGTPPPVVIGLKVAVIHPQVLGG